MKLKLDWKKDIQDVVNNESWIEWSLKEEDSYLPTLEKLPFKFTKAAIVGLTRDAVKVSMALLP